MIVYTLLNILSIRLRGKVPTLVNLRFSNSSLRFIMRLGDLEFAA